MSTEYKRFTDREHKVVCVDASQIAQRINLESPAGEIYIGLTKENAMDLLWGLRLACEHNDWELPW